MVYNAYIYSQRFRLNFVVCAFFLSGDFMKLLVVVVFGDSSTMPMHWNVFNEVVFRSSSFSSSVSRVCVRMSVYCVMNVYG